MIIVLEFEVNSFIKWREKGGEIKWYCLDGGGG